jgi:hypothetical protein
MSREGMKLTEWAQAERDEFKRDERDYGGGCSCCLGGAPCWNCTHPGNPRNQNECDECWEPEEQEAQHDYAAC